MTFIDAGRERMKTLRPSLVAGHGGEVVLRLHECQGPTTVAHHGMLALEGQHDRCCRLTDTRPRQAIFQQETAMALQHLALAGGGHAGAWVMNPR